MKRMFAILREKFRQNKSDFNGILRLCCTIVCYLYFHFISYFFSKYLCILKMNMERVTPNENEEYDPDTIVWDGEESEEELEGNEEYVDRGEWEEDTPEVSEEHETNEEQQWQESEIHMEEEESRRDDDDDEAEVPLINRRQERRS